MPSGEDRGGAKRGYSSGALLPGTLIADKYVIEEQLGGGGMGVVVAARHRHLGKRVAIKLLKDDSIDDEAVARFLREARAAVALQSEHVARVTDVGTLDTGLPYMIMELLRGIDLETLVDNKGPLPVADAVEYILHASEAIAEAHTLGIVHRDLKPANLFLTQQIDGTPIVKVLDFGIAKAIEEHAEANTNLTTTGMALGTPSYMSPEQVRDAKMVDRRTDIWGLGSVLYQLLSGEPPFHADSVPSLCAKIIADQHTPLRELRPDVPPELAIIVDTCLEKDMKRRFQTVTAFAVALAAIAPERSKEHVARILRIVQGRMSLSPDLGEWNQRDSLAETLSLTGENERDSLTTGSLAVSARGKEFQETARTWQTDSRPQHRRRALAVGGVVVLVGALAWLAPWEVDEPAPALALPSTPVVAAPPSEAPHVPTTTATEAPPPTPTASVAAPPSKLKPRQPKPPPVTSAATANPFNAPLDDRK